MENKKDGKQYAFFAHKQCEYYPCHKMPDDEEINCLFCFCPLYALGTACGGNYRYLDGNVKDCSACIVPHVQDGYSVVMRMFPKVKALAERDDEHAQNT